MNDQQILYQIPDSGPPISKARLATVLWIVAETMIFAGLLGAFVIARKSAPVWPPPYEIAGGAIVSPPRVEMEWPAINAGILVSAFIMAILAQVAAKRRELLRCRLRLNTVSILGICFLAVVLWEFISEAKRGVTIRSGTYGSYWAVITVAHALHVLAGVIWLQIALRSRRLAMSLGTIDKDRVDHLGLYWGFVTVVWIILLVLLHIY